MWSRGSHVGFFQPTHLTNSSVSPRQFFAVSGAMCSTRYTSFLIASWLAPFSRYLDAKVSSSLLSPPDSSADASELSPGSLSYVAGDPGGALGARMRGSRTPHLVAVVHW